MCYSIFNHSVVPSPLMKMVSSIFLSSFFGLNFFPRNDHDESAISQHRVPTNFLLYLISMYFTGFVSTWFIPNSAAVFSSRGLSFFSPLRSSLYFFGSRLKSSINALKNS